ncbi:redoxin domain-containing protein [Nonomuraea thailandensis]|uniref:redoxin domain-containing protein n=1 Tax=Nonomuraea thailandensis TaxID=1188745 RepID=UPI003614968B
MKRHKNPEIHLHSTPGTPQPPRNSARFMRLRMAVLVFYRGVWGPYCNLALRTYQKRLLPQLAGRGVELVGISPQTFQGSLAMRQTNELTFPVLSDVGNQLAARLGILTQPTPDTLASLARLGVDVAAANADGRVTVPNADCRHHRRRSCPPVDRCPPRLHFANRGSGHHRRPPRIGVVSRRRFVGRSWSWDVRGRRLSRWIQPMMSGRSLSGGRYQTYLLDEELVGQQLERLRLMRPQVECSPGARHRRLRQGGSPRAADADCHAASTPSAPSRYCR